MASLFGSRSIQRAAPTPLVVDTTPCYLMAGVQSEICALTAKKVETPQTAEPAAAAAATEVEPQPYKFGDITRGVMKAAVKMKDQAQAQMAVVPLRPILAPLATPASQHQSTGGASSSGTDFLNAAVAKARTLSTENASGTSLLQQFTSTSSNANAVDRTSFMCFSDPSGLGNQAGCAAVAFGQPYVLRANTKGGSVLTSDAKNDTQSHTRYSWGGPDATLGSQLCPCSSAGKAQGAAVCVGDTVWLLTADMSQVLVFQQNSADGSLELVARPREGLPQSQWAVLTVAPIQEEVKAKASSNDASFFASMLVATAAVTTATGTTNQVASAAAPHVKKAAAQRYSGPDAMSTMYGDAKTAASVGAAVANNPAAKALGSAMFSAAVDGARAANQREGKSVSGTSILLSAMQGASTTASNSQQQQQQQQR